MTSRPSPQLELNQQMSQIPDYYKILNVPRTATYEEVRQAYKKESLKWNSTLLNPYQPFTLLHSGLTRIDWSTSALQKEEEPLNVFK